MLGEGVFYFAVQTVWYSTLCYEYSVVLSVLYNSMLYSHQVLFRLQMYRILTRGSSTGDLAHQQLINKLHANIDASM